MSDEKEIGAYELEAETQAVAPEEVATTEKPEETPVVPAAEEVATPDASASRTGVAPAGARAGDECMCPDGRKGTVHSFDQGLICIPNHDQA